MTDKKVVVLTGAAKRVGRALAICLAEQGYRIVIHCNTSMEEALSLCQELEERGHEGKVVQGDLTESSLLEDLFCRFVEAFGCVDALINNASAFHSIPFEQMTLTQWQYDMALHATAPLFLSKALFSHIQQRGPECRATVINITDTQITTPPASRPSYYLSKATLAYETPLLARQLAPYVRVNAVAPGPVLSNGDGPYFAKMEQTLPSGRCGSPSDICEAVSYLLVSSFVTGMTIHVDGGQHLL